MNTVLNFKDSYLLDHYKEYLDIFGPALDTGTDSSMAKKVYCIKAGGMSYTALDLSQAEGFPLYAKDSWPPVLRGPHPDTDPYFDLERLSEMAELFCTYSKLGLMLKGVSGDDLSLTLDRLKILAFRDIICTGGGVSDNPWRISATAYCAYVVEDSSILMFKKNVSYKWEGEFALDEESGLVLYNAAVFGVSCGMTLARFGWDTIEMLMKDASPDNCKHIVDKYELGCVMDTFFAIQKSKVDSI